MDVLVETQVQSHNLHIESDDSTNTGSNVDKNFIRWRPSFHLVAPHGWLNDPCGPGYDPSAGVYHLAFQWNPSGNDWGNTSWGHSTSSDLISWKTSRVPCLTPSAPYDCHGIFTGCLVPTNLDGRRDGTLTYVYTSVNHLPIHYTLPYVRGCESLSVAVSQDGGSTWHRQPCNPILPGPPGDLRVTGWRDPFISSWEPNSTQLRNDGSGSQKLYGFVSGGLADATPTVFVYSINCTDLTEWRYIGTLLDVGINFRVSRWSGDLGVNWEVANVVTLGDEGASRDFVIMGTEGCLPRHESLAPGRGNQEIAKDRRIRRSQLWVSMKRRSARDPYPVSSPLMTYSFGGIFDHGCFYAANSFWDPVISQQVVFGWITEEDLPDPLRYRQNWSGMISLPRVVKLMTIHGVKRARTTSKLEDITSIEVTPDLDTKTSVVRTLGILPDSRVERLRHSARRSHISSPVRLTGWETLHSGNPRTSRENYLALTTSKWELQTEIAVGQHCSRAGVVIGHDVDFQSRTILYWEPLAETFVIERPQIRSPDHNVNHAPEIAPHTLFTVCTQSSDQLGKVMDTSSNEIEESLRIHAFYDVSVLEVFVNDRTAISTRIYLDNPRCYGIRFFADGPESDLGRRNSAVSLMNDTAIAVVQRATVWDGLEV